MNYLKIYEAGKMGGLTFAQMNDWRVELKNKLLDVAEDMRYKILVVNPCDFYNFEEVKHQSEEEVEDYDLAHVISSDIIVVNLDGLSTSDGTKFELHDGNYHNKIPVIAFGDKEVYDNLHPWIKRDITRVEDNIDNVVQYIKEFYMI
jgi:nucleoside 2-deoxyribosyltransferase